MQRRYYLLWLVAMAFAETGAAFDVSYHFGHVFDEFSIPHLTVAVGVCLMVGLLAWALVKERDRVVGLERAALWVAAGALAVGIADEPLDLLWHLTFGVDITMWSPTHLMLNYPADVLNVCIVTAFLASQAALARGAWAIVLAVLVRNVMTTHFALYQQEYGAVALDSLTRTGKAPWYVQPELWALAGPHARQLVTGGVPDWLYLVYTAFAIGYALALGATILRRGPGRKRPPDRWPWRFGAATGVAACFVLWRAAYRTFLVARHMAYGVIPWYLLLMGLALDLTLAFGPGAAERLLRAPAARRLLGARAVALRPQLHLVVAGAGGVLAALALFGGIELTRALHSIVPATPPLALPFACLTGAAGATLGAWVGTRVRVLVAANRAPAPERRRRGGHAASRRTRRPAATPVLVSSGAVRPSGRRRGR